MDNTILQQEFDDSFPVKGCECKQKLQKVDKDYKENLDYKHECIYVWHCEIVDCESGYKAKSHPKIGKARYLTALNRGRSQGGCDWIFDYIYFVPQGIDYSKLENMIHKKMVEFNLNKDGHKELYNLTIKQAIEKVKHFIEIYLC